MVLKNRTVLVFLFVEIASGVYSIALRFIPLLALGKGVEISVFLRYTALFTVINCIGSLIIAYSAKRADRKWVYLFDVGFDIVSICLFLVPNGKVWFLVGYCISLLKDMFSPISFGYLYDCIEHNEGEKNAPTVLGVLDSISNIVSIFIPILIGAFWNKYFNGILGISMVLLILAVTSGILILPVNNDAA